MTVKADLCHELADTAEDMYFFAIDGHIYKSLYDLSLALDRMNREVFNFHVAAFKNDFSKWILDVFSDCKLARDLGNATNSQEAAQIVRKRIIYLEKRCKAK